MDHQPTNDTDDPNHLIEIKNQKQSLLQQLKDKKRKQFENKMKKFNVDKSKLNKKL